MVVTSQDELRGVRARFDRIWFSGSARHESDTRCASTVRGGA